jgi:cytochrome c biogenesis protein CcmG, thiol:disulfide interchange protein DsbE
MAWNPRQVWIAMLVAGFLVGSWGCEPPKKTDKTPKEKVSNETSTPESTVNKDEESPLEPSEKPESIAKKPSETPAITEDENPPVVPAPKANAPEKSKVQPPDSAGVEPAAKPAPTAPTKTKTAKKSLPPPATISKVSLTDKLRATCLVKVGDELPEVELAGLDGNKASLKSLHGDALTVVFFWNIGTTTFARQSVIEALGDMQKDVLEPFTAKDLKVVGINVGNKPEDVKKALETSGASYPNLLDPQGNFFRSVAMEKLPRVYLLDGSGKILWFDIDYARATRRELLTGIKAVLEGKK